MELERLKTIHLARVAELRTPIRSSRLVMTMLDHGERLDSDAAPRHADALSHRERAALRGSSKSSSRSPSRNPASSSRNHADEDAQAAERGGDVGHEPVGRERRHARDLVLTIDPELTARALGFLVDNAAKYGDEALIVATEDGVIEVSTAVRAWHPT